MPSVPQRYGRTDGHTDDLRQQYRALQYGHLLTQASRFAIAQDQWRKKDGANGTVASLLAPKNHLFKQSTYALSGNE